MVAADMMRDLVLHRDSVAEDRAVGVADMDRAVVDMAADLDKT